MDDTEKRATNIRRLEEIENDHAHIKCKRDTAERLAARFEPGGELHRKATERFADNTMWLRASRRQLAQQIFDTYAVGVDKNGQIIWESDQS
jgi:hypothetical protein